MLQNINIDFKNAKLFLTFSMKMLQIIFISDFSKIILFIDVNILKTD